MINIKSAIVILCSACILVACASTEDSRYKDNRNLERPPEVVPEKLTAEQIEINERQAPKRKHGKGLGTDVYKVEDSGHELRIKRGFDEAWHFMSRAIQHNELKITDQDRSKGVFYVSFNGGGFLNSAAGFFSDSKDQTTYLLKVEDSDEETAVAVSLAAKDEQANANSAKHSDNPEDKSADLLDLLYDTLHDDIKDE